MTQAHLNGGKFLPCAKRTLTSSFGQVEVWMGMPTEDAESGDFRCEYGINGPLTNRQGHIFGADGFQALQLCLERIATDLLFCDEGQRGALRWFDAAYETGFPLPRSIENLASGKPSASEPRD